MDSGPCGIVIGCQPEWRADAETASLPQLLLLGSPSAFRNIAPSPLPGNEVPRRLKPAFWAPDGGASLGFVGRCAMLAPVYAGENFDPSVLPVSGSALGC
jgi:hypothetical protein